MTHTITVEVFGLAQLMLFVAIWLWLKTLTYRGHIYLAMLGVVATLAGLHHPLAGIVSGLLLWERIFEYSRKKSWKKIGYIVSGMLLALVLTYRLYVWLGMREPGSFWWPISTNFEGIWRFFWRQDYAADGSAIERYTNSWSWPWALVSAREWMKRYIQDMGWSVILLILFAWIYVLKRFKKVFWLSLVVFLISGVGIAGYLLYPQASTATDSEFYWGSLLLYRMHYVAVVTGSLLSGLGVLWLKKFGRLVVVGASALLLLISLYRLQTAPLIGLTAREWYSLEILAMPRDSVVIVGNDLVFSLLYTQDVLGERKDLLVVPLRLFVRDKELVKRVQNPAVYDEVDYVARATHIVHWAQNSNRNVFLLGYDANMMDKLIFDGGPYTACPQGSLLEITRGPCSDTGIIYVADKSRVTNEWDKGFVGWLAETYAIQAYYAGRNGLAVEAQEYAAEAKSLAELNMTRQEIAATINFSYSTQIRNEIPVGELEQLAINAMSENSNEEAERMIRQALTIEPESKKLRQLWLKVARAQGYNALAQRLERYIALYN